jgi:dTDP-glucose 4,6-dehydratase
MNIFGEMQDPEKFVPRVIKSILNNQAVEIHATPDGTIGSRFYLHARNQADGLLFLLRQFGERGVRRHPEASTPERYHIVGERELSNLEMAQMIADIVGDVRGYDVNLNYALTPFHDARPGHDLRYALDGRRMAELGWQPPVSLEKSLRRTVEWTLARPEWLS